MSDILKAQVPIPCPACGSSLKVSLADVQRGRVVRCPQGHEVHLKEDGDNIRQVERAIDDFKRSIEQINRRLRR
mgnify:CR=1 FL=1